MATQSQDEPTLGELRKLINECLKASDTSDLADSNCVNKQKKSSDLLAVKFPTFVTRRSRSSIFNQHSKSIVPAQSQLPARLPTILEDEEYQEPKEEPATDDKKKEEQNFNTEPANIKQSKFSSSGNLTFESSISRPDLVEVLQCVARAVHIHISRGAARSQKSYMDIFNEVINPLIMGWDTIHTPSVYVIYEYIRVIFQYHKMDAECSVMSLIYIERFLEISELTIDCTNWRRIILAAIIVSDKMWEEHTVWTQDFLHIFNDFITVQDLNNLEFAFLGQIHYNLAITASTYATYYFELRSFCTKESKLPPLKKKVARKLERQTSKQMLPPIRSRRSMSLGEPVLTA